MEAPESGNKIEVLVPAYKREGMLAAERGDPKIAGAGPLVCKGPGLESTSI
jgi:hypothetical protein